MLTSDCEDEGVTVIYADRNPNTPSTSTSQTNQDLPSTSSPQTINISPPPTLLLHSNILREVYDNIFNDLVNLFESINNPIHTKSYEEKWIALREVVDIVFCYHQRLSVEAQNQSLQN